MLAIVSHPNAGKMTLTEKLLLYGSAINLVGSAKGRKTGKYTASDWMDIEKERGIPVTSSVLQSNYESFYINILGMPGHEDLSEDTYRTLTAADSAVMMTDASKGVETQTRKLFEVYTLRYISIFTFIDKMDHEARNLFALTDEIEGLLGIRTCSVNWPIGSGKNFKGVFDRNTKKITIFRVAHTGMQETVTGETDLSDPAFESAIGENCLAQLAEKTGLPDSASDELDTTCVSRDDLTPVFFGSTLANFGVEAFLEHFLKMTTLPPPRRTKSGEINPTKNLSFSALVFKIQANMNKVHRDCVVFMCTCSNEYQAGMEVTRMQGKQKMRLNQSMRMMADERETVEAAYAGDIIGVFDPSILAIGDMPENAWESIVFGGILIFAPKHLTHVRQIDTVKHKQFMRDIGQIAQEGVTQISQERNTDVEGTTIGAVGMLQSGALTYYPKAEYNVEVRLDTLPYEYIRQTNEPETVDIGKIRGISDMKLIQNPKGEPLLLFAHPWSIRMVEERSPGLKLLEFGES